MIVVDSNIVAYYWVNGPLTALAQRVGVKDPDWHAPILWRSEMRTILTGYLRDGSLTGPQVARIMEAADRVPYRLLECFGGFGKPSPSIQEESDSESI